MIVSNIIQTQYNRFFSDTRELCPLFMSIFHQMHFVVQSDCGSHKIKSFSNKLFSFKPHADSVLSKHKCSLSSLISKQGFQESFEIALFFHSSTAMQFQSHHSHCACTQFVSLQAPLNFHTSNCRCRGKCSPDKVHLLFIFHFLLTLLLLHTGVVTDSPDSH